MDEFRYSIDDFTDIMGLLEHAKKGNYISHDKFQSPLVTRLIDEAISLGYIMPKGNAYIISEKGHLFLEELSIKEMSIFSKKYISTIIRRHRSSMLSKLFKQISFILLTLLIAYVVYKLGWN